MNKKDLSQANALWEKAKELIRNTEKSNELTNQTVEKLSVKNFEDNRFYLATDKEVVKTIILLHYLDNITEALSSVCGYPVHVEIIVDESEVSDAWRKMNEQSRQNRERQNIINNASFDNEPVKSLNPAALKMAIKIIDQPSKACPPVCFYGGSALERSCFMYAFMKRLQEQQSEEVKFVPVSSEYLSEELIRGLKEHAVEKYINKYREADCFIIVSSIHVLFRGETIEHELYLLLSDLADRNKPVIMLSAPNPIEIQCEDSDMRSFLQKITSVSLENTGLQK